MPADVRFHVVLDRDFGQGKGFIGIALSIDDERLQGNGVAMVGVLTQNLFCSFDSWL